MARSRVDVNNIFIIFICVAGQICITSLKLYRQKQPRLFNLKCLISPLLVFPFRSLKSNRKSRIRETLNLSTDADSITITMRRKKIMVGSFFNFIFKASLLWADAFYKSICQYVCVCLFVHFLRYRLNVFLPQLSEVGCPIFLEI